MEALMDFWSLFWSWSKYGIAFFVVSMGLGAIAHETAKALWKEFLGWLWPKVFKRPYPLPYK